MFRSYSFMQSHNIFLSLSTTITCSTSVSSSRIPFKRAWNTPLSCEITKCSLCSTLAWQFHKQNLLELISSHSLDRPSFLTVLFSEFKNFRATPLHAAAFTLLASAAQASFPFLKCKLSSFRSKTYLGSRTGLGLKQI